MVRGASSDVDRAVKDINKIIENAKKDEIVNSYVSNFVLLAISTLADDSAQSTEFDIDREYVGRIVGAQGVGVNKLRDQLGVKVDVSDEGEEKEKEGGKKKKAVHQRSKVKVSAQTITLTLVVNRQFYRLLDAKRTWRKPSGAYWPRLSVW